MAPIDDEPTWVGAVLRRLRPLVLSQGTALSAAIVCGLAAFYLLGLGGLPRGGWLVLPMLVVPAFGASWLLYRRAPRAERRAVVAIAVLVSGIGGVAVAHATPPAPTTLTGRLETMRLPRYTRVELTSRGNLWCRPCASAVLRVTGPAPTVEANLVEVLRELKRVGLATSISETSIRTDLAYALGLGPHVRWRVDVAPYTEKNGSSRAEVAILVRAQR